LQGVHPVCTLGDHELVEFVRRQSGILDGLDYFRAEGIDLFLGEVRRPRFARDDLQQDDDGHTDHPAEHERANALAQPSLSPVRTPLSFGGHQIRQHTADEGQHDHPNGGKPGASKPELVESAADFVPGLLRNYEVKQTSDARRDPASAVTLRCRRRENPRLTMSRALPWRQGRATASWQFAASGRAGMSRRPAAGSARAGWCQQTTRQ